LEAPGPARRRHRRGGLVAPQLGGGRFGGIIIDDAIDQLPELAASTERLLVLSDPTVGDSPSVLDVSRHADHAGSRR